MRPIIRYVAPCTRKYYKQTPWLRSYIWPLLLVGSSRSQYELRTPLLHPPPKKMASNEAKQELIKVAIGSCSLRHFFIANDDCMGVCPRRMELGDIDISLYRCKIPYILREEELKARARCVAVLSSSENASACIYGTRCCKGFQTPPPSQRGFWPLVEDVDIYDKEFRAKYKLEIANRIKMPVCCFTFILESAKSMSPASVRTNLRPALYILPNWS
jgi:hypothetical protein